MNRLDADASLMYTVFPAITATFTLCAVHYTMADVISSHNGDTGLSRRTFLTGGLLAPAVMGAAMSPSVQDNVLSFGIVTDVHYAQLSSDGSRYYTDLYEKLRDAMGDFTVQNVDFVVELGDLIHAAGERKDEIGHLEEIDNVYRSFPKDRYHVLGNHDLQLLTKKEFLRYVNQPESRYSFDAGGFHFVVLDACFSPDGSEYAKGHFDWTKPYIPESELAWLADDLHAATGQPVIVFTHQTLHNDGFRHCVVNAPTVRALLETHGDVRAVFQGHMHYNQHAVIGGIHYITLSAMVNGRTRETNPYGIVRLADDGVIAFDGYSQRAYSWDPSEPWVQPETGFGRRW